MDVHPAPASRSPHLPLAPRTYLWLPAQVVVTKFSLEDYAEFLGEEWPLSLMQPIKVFTES